MRPGGPRLAAVEQHRRHDHLVEHPRHGGGHALLRDDGTEATPYPAGASKLAPRGMDIAVIAPDDTPKPLEDLHAAQRLVVSDEDVLHGSRAARRHGVLVTPLCPQYCGRWR